MIPRSVPGIPSTCVCVMLTSKCDKNVIKQPHKCLQLVHVLDRVRVLDRVVYHFKGILLQLLHCMCVIVH